MPKDKEDTGENTDLARSDDKKKIVMVKRNTIKKLSPKKNIKLNASSTSKKTPRVKKMVKNIESRVQDSNSEKKIEFKEKKVRNLIEQFEEMDRVEAKVTEIDAPVHVMKKVDAFNILMSVRKDAHEKPSGKKKKKRLTRENVTPRKNRKIEEWLRK